MAQYRADVWLGSASGRQEVTVNANTSYGAKEQIMNIYDVEENEIRNLRQVSGGGSGGSSIEGGGWLVGLVALGAVWVYLTPWITMLAGGALGAWASQKLIGSTLEEVTDNDNDKGLAIILAASLALGGFGFVQGNNWNKQIHSDSDSKVQEVRKVQQ
jgi:hypothetical protein